MTASRATLLRGRATRPAMFVALLLAGCAAPGPRAFSSADKAAAALAELARTGDPQAADALFGMEGAEELVTDPTGDEAQRTRFLELYAQAHRLEPNGDGTLTLLVGTEEWPFPVPLAEGDGGWSFDTAAGLQELACREVGCNELAAIEVCRAIVDAQHEYAALSFEGKPTGVFAQRLCCSAGAAGRDGLYWPTADGESESPLGPLVAEAQAWGDGSSGAQDRRPCHGYLFRLLAAQGPHAPGRAGSYVEDGRLTRGFAVLAFPAEYGRSGIMSFVAGRDGIVYEADLGADTIELAGAMQAYDPGPEWSPCR